MKDQDYKIASLILWLGPLAMLAVLLGGAMLYRAEGDSGLMHTIDGLLKGAFYLLFHVGLLAAPFAIFWFGYWIGKNEGKND